jgi:hypothetical protein
MARSPRNAATDVETLAEQLMPGWKAVSSVTSTTPEPGATQAVALDAINEAKPDAVMPTLEELQAKYFGAPASAEFADTFPDRDADTALVDMQNGPLTKTVAISRSERKVVWFQG